MLPPCSEHAWWRFATELEDLAAEAGGEGLVAEMRRVVIRFYVSMLAVVPGFVGGGLLTFLGGVRTNSSLTARGGNLMP